MAWPRPLADRGLVLLVGDRLQPFDVLAVERFLHGHMHHDRGRPGAVPMLFARRNPDHVAGAKRTRPERMRPGAGASMTGSCQTTPVKESAGPRRDAREPQG